MDRKVLTTRELYGVRVVGGKSGNKRIGKVRSFVFHPSEKRCVGFTVKRPDMALMFHRKDLFVSLDGFDIEDGRIVVHGESEATDRGACKALGINWDDCVLWSGMPLMSKDGRTYGTVGNVTFDARTGAVISVETNSGATANALLGRREIPARMILGFRTGMGVALREGLGDAYEEDEETPVLGAILVSDEVLNLAPEGGAAEAAGKATAVVVDKAKTTVEKVKPKVSEATAVAGEAINKGAYAVGKQAAKTTTMFSDFKKEFDKASGKEEKKAEAEATEEGTVVKKTSSTTKTASKKTSKATASGGKKTTTNKASKKESKNMFAAFKEEFDKARK